jgi:hypothetical protein
MTEMIFDIRGQNVEAYILDDGEQLEFTLVDFGKDQLVKIRFSDKLLPHLVGYLKDFNLKTETKNETESI